MKPDDLTTPNPWQQLRQLTPARIALGRAGTSLPTRAQLEFQLAHAQARDAVHYPFEPRVLAETLQARGFEVVMLHSAARDRAEYLQRPDLGRRLDAASRSRLEACAAGPCDLALVVADGLSALAVERHALPMLLHIREQTGQEGWTLGPVVLAEQGRVAIADEIGQILQAQASVILLGERPGLSAPDSLGLYLTHAPHIGCHDAQRNCISNVRAEGLDYGEASHRLLYLLREARRRQLSGVQLKEAAEVRPLDAPRGRNFLLDVPEEP